MSWFRRVHAEMGITSDRNDPRLRERSATGMHDTYLVLSEEERAKGFAEPVRQTYIHETCGSATTMGLAIAETYARDPGFYGATFCASCNVHRPVGADGEFVWQGTTQKVGTRQFPADLASKDARPNRG